MGVAEIPEDCLMLIRSPPSQRRRRHVSSGSQRRPSKCETWWFVTFEEHACQAGKSDLYSTAFLLRLPHAVAAGSGLNDFARIPDQTWLK